MKTTPDKESAAPPVDGSPERSDKVSAGEATAGGHPEPSSGDEVELLLEKDPVEAKKGSRKLSKKEILARLLEKNEMILQLSRDKAELMEQQKLLKDKWVRSVADFENYRKRSRKEWELLKQQTSADIILEVLNVVDDFERAFSVAGERKDDFVQGIRLIHNNLLSSLDKLGVTKMEALKSPFDPTYHMAVAQVESKDAKTNHVIEVVQEGYMLGDTVIRPAKVVIAK